MNKIKKSLFFSSCTNSVGICLSGGAALGFAHIGVLQALEEHEIFLQYIAGTSMGAIVGTLYAAGYSPADMLQLIKRQKLYKIMKMMSFHSPYIRSGLSNHTMLRELLKELIPHNSFEQLQKKLYVCVTNLNAAQWEIIKEGTELDKWVAASASIPGLFEAIKDNSHFYVDGALLNNLPAQALEDVCHTIIGVDVIPHVELTDLHKPIDTLVASIRVMQNQNSIIGRNLCQYIIEPRCIDAYHEFSFESYQAIYQCGYDTTVRCIEENPKMLRL